MLPSSTSAILTSSTCGFRADFHSSRGLEQRCTYCAAKPTLSYNLAMEKHWKTKLIHSDAKSLKAFARSTLRFIAAPPFCLPTRRQ